MISFANLIKILVCANLFSQNSMLMSPLQILDKVKDLYNLTSEKELAQFLGLKQSALSGWRMRNTLNYEILFERCKGVDLNVLIHGEPLAKSQNIVQEPNASYEVENRNSEIEMLVKENQELKSRLEECRELVVRVSAGQRNVIYGGKVAATPPEED